MDPDTEILSMYARPSEEQALPWSWVLTRLESAGTYWVVARGRRHPHARPVWGIWEANHLFLSIGSPTILRQLQKDPAITVHLDSGTDVVIVEGSASGPPTTRSALERYDAKYRWNYDVAEHGPLTSVIPARVMAWRSVGRAGRDGFRATGRWRFHPPTG